MRVGFITLRMWTLVAITAASRSTMTDENDLSLSRCKHARVHSLVRT